MKATATTSQPPAAGQEAIIDNNRLKDILADLVNGDFLTHEQALFAHVACNSHSALVTALNDTVATLTALSAKHKDGMDNLVGTTLVGARAALMAAKL